MGFTEAYNIAYSSVAAVAELSKKIGGNVLKATGVIQSDQPVLKLPTNLQNLQVEKLVQMGNPSVRIAAISGAMACILGAYGAHTLPLKENYEERKLVYDTANRYHFFHTLALLGIPMSKFPKTAASLMTLGMVLFCGTCYYQAFTGDKKLKQLTPIGGTLLICGWLTMVL